MKGCNVNYNGTGISRQYGEETYIVGGFTALHLAATGQPEFVEKLLTIGDIIVDPIAEDGKTPLTHAIIYAQPKVVRMLDGAGADIFAEDSYGYQPINIAVAYGQLELVKTLIELGADVDQGTGSSTSTTTSNDTPLIIGAYYGYVDIVEYLVKIGAALDRQNSEDKTALDYAREQGHQEVEKILREAATG